MFSILQFNAGKIGMAAILDRRMRKSMRYSHDGKAENYLKHSLIPEIEVRRQELFSVYSSIKKALSKSEGKGEGGKGWNIGINY